MRTTLNSSYVGRRINLIMYMRTSAVTSTTLKTNDCSLINIITSINLLLIQMAEQMEVSIFILYLYIVTIARITSSIFYYTAYRCRNRSIFVSGDINTTMFTRSRTTRSILIITSNHSTRKILKHII